MKRNLMAIVAVFLAWLSAKPALALYGNDAGNGGYGIVCPKPGGKQEVLLLDFYEAEFRKIYYSLGRKNSVEEKVSLAISRLAPLDKARAKRYQDRANHFKQNSQIIPNIVLQGKIDYVTSKIRKGCAIGLIAVQRKPQFEEDSRYTISEDLWNGMDDDHKAGLILHEIVYQDALESGQEDSVGTRYFVSVLASERMATMQKPAYQDLLRRTALAETSTTEPSLWAQDPITLSIQARRIFILDLSRSFHAPSADSVRYELSKDAPKFVNLSSAGILGGAPGESNVGEYAFFVIADTGKERLPVTVHLLVSKPANTPFTYHWDAAPNQPFMANIETEDGTLKLISGPAWLSVSASGNLFGTPSRNDVGENGFVLEIENGQSVKQLNVTIVVKGESKPPVWSMNPIDLGKITAGTAWTFDVSKFATSPNGSPMTFSAANLPAWMTLSSSGILSGTPQQSDVGTFSHMVFNALNDQGSDTTSAFGEVLSPSSKR